MSSLVEAVFPGRRWAVPTLEAVSTWNGVVLNDPAPLDSDTRPYRFRCSKIDLRGMAEPQLPTDPVIAGLGSVARPGSRGGKTAVYEGAVEAVSADALREGTDVLEAAFLDVAEEGRMDISLHESYSADSYFFRGRGTVNVLDDPGPLNAVPTPYTSSFVVAISLSDPRIYDSAPVTVEFAITPGSPGSGDPKTVDLATTGHIPLTAENGTLFVDGWLASTSVLVKDQADAAANGIYDVAFNDPGGSGWELTRSSDADSSAEMTPGMLVWVLGGNVNADTGWYLSTPSPITLGTTPLTFERYEGIEVDNPGRASSPLVMTLNGPWVRPLVVDLTRGVSLQLDYEIPSGSHVGVDLGQGTIMLNGNVDLRDTLVWPGSDLWSNRHRDLPAGLTSWGFFADTEFALGVRAELSFFPAFP